MTPRIVPSRRELAAVTNPVYGAVLWRMHTETGRLLEAEHPDLAALKWLCADAEQARNLGNAIVNDPPEGNPT